MAITYLISLISDHLLPNYLFIKEMAGKYDKLLFITTEKMEDAGIGKRLEKALGLKENAVQRIVVSEENLNETLAKLKSVLFSNEDRFMVNLTCGTKIMSIGVFTHFITYKGNADFYYIPIEVNKIETVLTGQDLPLNYRVNVEEYLALYGLSFTNETVSKREVADNKSANFEVYICNRLRTELGIRDKYIFRGVKLYRQDSKQLNDNEIDVMWMAENQIFVGECKLSLMKAMYLDKDKKPVGNPVEYLDEIMYKLAAISKDFGLRVNSYIFTKHRFDTKTFNESRMNSIKKRMKILGIKGLLGAEELKNNKLNI